MYVEKDSGRWECDLFRNAGFSMPGIGLIIARAEPLRAWSPLFGASIAKIENGGQGIGGGIDGWARGYGFGGTLPLVGAVLSFSYNNGIVKRAHYNRIVCSLFIQRQCYKAIFSFDSARSYSTHPSLAWYPTDCATVFKRLIISLIIVCKLSLTIQCPVYTAPPPRRSH